MTAPGRTRIETAQPEFDCKALETLPQQTVILGVIDLDDMSVETPETVAGRTRIVYLPLYDPVTHGCKDGGIRPRVA